MFLTANQQFLSYVKYFKITHQKLSGKKLVKKLLFGDQQFFESNLILISKNSESFNEIIN